MSKTDTETDLNRPKTDNSASSEKYHVSAKTGCNLHHAQDTTGHSQTKLVLKQKSDDLGETAKGLKGFYGLSLLTGDPKLSFDQVCQGAVDLLPSVWQYSESTCGRIIINRVEYTTANYIDSVWKQTADIMVGDIVVGLIEIGLLEEMPTIDEGPFLAEERLLIDGLARMIGQYFERFQSERRLRDSNVRLIEGQLALEDKNTALSDIIEHVDRDRKELALKIQSNVNRVVGPILSRLEAQVDEHQREQLAIIRSTLADLTSPFVNSLEKGMTNLSPREVEICSMIRNGLSSKEIAQSLQTSEATVRTQRKSIRRKLGLPKGKVNLATYLQQV